MKRNRTKISSFCVENVTHSLPFADIWDIEGEESIMNRMMFFSYEDGDMEYEISCNLEAREDYFNRKEKSPCGVHGWNEESFESDFSDYYEAQMDSLFTFLEETYNSNKI